MAQIILLDASFTANAQISSRWHPRRKLHATVGTHHLSKHKLRSIDGTSFAAQIAHIILPDARSTAQTAEITLRNASSRSVLSVCRGACVWKNDLRHRCCNACAICAPELVSQRMICAICAVGLVSGRMLCAICAVDLAYGKMLVPWMPWSLDGRRRSVPSVP